MMRQSLSTTLVIIAFVMVFGTVARTLADPPARTAVCHATSSASNPFTYLLLPPEPLSAHFDEHGTPQAGHETDFFPMDNDCDRSNDPGGGDPPGPGPVPEPITILLFGGGVAGIGYITRRMRRKNGDG